MNHDDLQQGKKASNNANFVFCCFSLLPSPVFESIAPVFAHSSYFKSSQVFSGKGKNKGKIYPHL